MSLLRRQESSVISLLKTPLQFKYLRLPLLLARAHIQGLDFRDITVFHLQANAGAGGNWSIVFIKLDRIRNTE